jgi:hypothetical protein
MGRPWKWEGSRLGQPSLASVGHPPLWVVTPLALDPVAVVTHSVRYDWSGVSLPPILVLGPSSVGSAIHWRIGPGLLSQILGWEIVDLGDDRRTLIRQGP